MVKTREIADTPLMRQYASIKARYPDALLLFRVGDFYETFGEDAVKTSQVLGIVLTRRANGAASFVELAGFPHHSLDLYLPKLVKAGYRVAICDQLEDPKLAKTIVKRGVTELVTPGVSLHDRILEQKENNFLAGIHLDPRKPGVAFLDISTGEFYLAEGSVDYIDKLIQSLHPSEVIVQKSNRQRFTDTFGGRHYISTFDDWVFVHEFACELLLKHFGTASLKGFGVENMDHAVIAAGAVMHYLSETQHDKLSHICKLTRVEEDQYVWLDRFTIRNLELLQTPNEHAKTLLDVLDLTVSPMASRLLRRWLVLPLKNRQPIEERLDLVEHFFKDEEQITLFRKYFREIGDLERLIAKVAVGKIAPREMIHLARAIEQISGMKRSCEESGCEGLQKAGEQLTVLRQVKERIEREIRPDSPALAGKGNIIREGVSEELDTLRTLAFSGKDYLVQIQQREQELTGISSLKIGYTNVFGYYLEVTNTHKDKVPASWQRKQTLVNSERYITDELKAYEEKILGAEEKILGIELKIYQDLVLFVAESIQPIQVNANAVARLDVLVTFAHLARLYGYRRPVFNDSYAIEIKGGRHAVIERQMKPGEDYIANDVYLDDSTQQIIILTGPNMSGKSALLRQTALIVLLAQMGSFVPAGSATLGLVDKVFTRVGASDNISSGESTFMVEMNETASILNNISNRSLILLDEIGRGTSTYDGISIAWAMAEFLHQHPLFRPKVLFATHYHELNELAALCPRIRNYHVSIQEIGNRVLFLRKILPGGSEHSFGIHVARMAGMPPGVLERAEEMLAMLEAQGAGHRIQGPGSQTVPPPAPPQHGRGASRIRHSGPDVQLSFIQLDDPLLEQIKQDILSTEINTLTPVEALMKLNEIKKLLEKK